MFKEKYHSPVLQKKEEFVEKRVFQAPRELLWKSWTEPNRLAQWWGPKGYTMISHSMEFNPGGSYLYSMRSPEGNEMWGKFMYREIFSQERIIFVNSFSNKDGKIMRHPMSATWPLEILSMVFFTAQGDKTLLTLRGTPINCTPDEYKTFLDGIPSMHNGFQGTFNQLDEYLKSVTKGVKQ